MPNYENSSDSSEFPKLQKCQNFENWRTLGQVFIYFCFCRQFSAKYFKKNLEIKQNQTNSYAKSFGVCFGLLWALLLKYYSFRRDGTLGCFPKQFWYFSSSFQSYLQKQTKCFHSCQQMRGNNLLYRAALEKNRAITVNFWSLKL